MVLPPGAEIVEFMPNGKDLVVLEGKENYQKEEEEEGGGDRAKDQEQMSWEESFLLRFSQFLGMSLEGSEDEVLDLMNKICVRRQKEEGKEGKRMTKFAREMKLEWNIKEKDRSSRGETSQGMRALLLRY